MRFAGVVFRPLRSPTRRAELWILKRRDDQRPVMMALADLLRELARHSPDAAGFR
jgi:hypothetical protein